MGAWGSKAFENDGAADWFADLWEEHPVPRVVEETLNRDPGEHHEEIRAAAHLLIQLGDTYRWPVGDIDRHCALAADQLDHLRSMDVYQDPAFQQELAREAEVLRSRIQP